MIVDHWSTLFIMINVHVDGGFSLMVDYDAEGIPMTKQLCINHEHWGFIPPIYQYSLAYQNIANTKVNWSALTS